MFITPSFKKSLIVEQFQGNYLNMQKQYEKNVWEKSYDAHSLSIRVQTTKNHI